MRKAGAWTGIAIAAGLVAIWPASFVRPAEAAPVGECGPIVTPGQVALERTANAVFASAPLKREQAKLTGLYRADPQGATPAGRATTPRAVASIARAAAQYYVNNASQPQPMWVVKAPLRTQGVAVGRSGYGIDNPDNVYRNIPIEASSFYEITGRLGPGGPVEQHFTLMDSIPGTKPMTVEAAGFVGTLRSDELETGPDGRFTITVDPTPANGRKNHIQSKGSGVLPLVVRDLFTDWGSQQPIALTVRKLSGPDIAAPSLADLSRDAADLLAKIGPFWLAYDNNYIYSRPANAFAMPRLRPGGRGISTSGWFQLQGGEALMVTLDPLGAKSLGFQLTDPWGVAYEYIDRTSSLNNTQARANPDGTITYVIAARDPGVANWLDPSGNGSGMMTLRWQGLPDGVNPDLAIREVRKVALAALPAGIARITPGERRAQLQERAASYWRRTFGPAPAAACRR